MLLYGDREYDKTLVKKRRRKHPKYFVKRYQQKYPQYEKNEIFVWQANRTMVYNCDTGETVHIRDFTPELLNISKFIVLNMNGANLTAKFLINLSKYKTREIFPRLNTAYGSNLIIELLKKARLTNEQIKI